MLLKKSVKIKANISENKTFTFSKCQQLKQINKTINSILSEDKYISQKEYMSFLRQNQEVISFFDTLVNGDILDAFCSKNFISSIFVHETLDKYKNLTSLVDEHNDKYVSKKMEIEKDYLDNILKDVDPNIKLDEDQRKVVLLLFTA